MTAKSIDAFTIVRILKEQIGETAAAIQYGILSGKVETLITIPFSFNMAFAVALVPGVAGYIAVGRWAQARRRIEFSILITILIGLPCMAIMGIFAEPILQLLFPNASSGSILLSLSSIGIIFVVLIQTLTGALQGLRKVVVPVIALGIGTIIKLVLNIILIERIGINGAAISSIVCYVISFIICFAALKKNINIKFKVNQFVLKPIIATGGMCVCSYWIYQKFMLGLNLNRNISFLTALLIGVIIYILFIIILKIFNKEELLVFPNGEKLYKVFVKLKIYRKQKTPAVSRVLGRRN